jgi:hypothetical protein
VFLTPAGRANRASFARQAATWRTPLLPMDRGVTDADFPDLWHLSEEKAGEFTRALAAGWVRLGRPGFR